jgi:hypothetical protein
MAIVAVGQSCALETSRLMTITKFLKSRLALADVRGMLLHRGCYKDRKLHLELSSYPFHLFLHTLSFFLRTPLRLYTFALLLHNLLFLFQSFNTTQLSTWLLITV